MIMMLRDGAFVSIRMSLLRSLVCSARRRHRVPGPAEWRRLFSAEAARTEVESEREDDPSSVFRRIVMARSSVRGFENRAVPKEVLQDVLSLTLRCPSSFNINPYTIVMVQSSEAREALADCMLGPNRRRVREAPISAVFAADLDPVKLVPRVVEMERKAGAAEHYLASLSFNVSFMAGQGKLAHAFKDIVTTAMSPLQPMPSVSSPEAWSFRDTAFASAWYMLAAGAHGLDTSPMEGLDARRVKAALGIPERYAIPLVVATGYRKEGPQRKSPRPQPETLVFKDRFGNGFTGIPVL